MSGRGAAIAAVGAACVAAVTGIAGQRRWAEYAAREQYLSELGARHAPDGAAASVGFFLTGVLLLVALADLVTGRRRRAWPRAARLGVVGGLGGFAWILAVAVTGSSVRRWGGGRSAAAG